MPRNALTSCVVGVACGLSCLAGVYNPAADIPLDMPAPSNPSPVPQTPGGVVKCTRVEVMTQDGLSVAVVFTSRGNVPIAIVNDGGKAREIDLAKVARMVR